MDVLLDANNDDFRTSVYKVSIITNSCLLTYKSKCLHRYKMGFTNLNFIEDLMQKKTQF